MNVDCAQVEGASHALVLEQSESCWQSKVQSLAHPWPVPLTLLPKSHCSGASTMPSPHDCGGVVMQDPFWQLEPVPQDDPLGSGVPAAQACP